MTPELLALAAAVTALPGWRWAPGMLTVRVEPLTYHSEGVDPASFIGRAYRVQAVSQERDAVRCDGECFRLASPDFGPDLTDAATGGAMLALLAPCNVTVDSEGDAWMREPGLDSEPFRTLAEACARVALARGRWS